MNLVNWAQFLKMGTAVTDEALAARVAEVKPEHAAGVVYTSGTTGNPKVWLHIDGRQR